MLAIYAVTAVFGLGMIMDAMATFEVPETGSADTADDEDPSLDTALDALPSQDSLVTAEGATTLSENADVFAGTDAAETVVGGGGNDELRGQNGADWIEGGFGDDTLLGGAGDDALSGGAGDDYILGGSGGDVATGGLGDDRVVLGDDADVYDTVNASALGFAEGGDDLVRGGDGNDVLRDVFGQDTLLGGAGNDTLVGGDRAFEDTLADILHGGDGNDALVGDDGDTLEGGAGVDRFTIAYDGATDFEAVVITDLDVGTESLSLPSSSFGPDANMSWEATFDAMDNSVTVLLSGTHTVDGALVTLNQEPVVVLQNMSADALTNLDIRFDQAA